MEVLSRIESLISNVDEWFRLTEIIRVDAFRMSEGSDIFDAYFFGETPIFDPLA